MTILQTGLRSLAGNSAVRWAQTRAQQLSSNAFTERLSEASAKLRLHRQTTLSAPGVHSQTPVQPRQLIDSQRRDLASTSHTSAPPTPVLPPAARSSLDAVITAAPVNVRGVNSETADQDGDTSGMPPAVAAVYGSRTDPVVAALLQQNAPPATYAAVGAGSTDPAVFRTDGYIKALNLNSFLQIANHDNTYRYDRYKNALHEWSEHGMQDPPPAPPKYETVDLNGFNDWWARYTPGYDQPSPTSFVTNGPKDGGYGWTA